MYHNGHDYKNLQEYVEVGYDLHPHELTPNDEDGWMQFTYIVLDYHSSMGEFTEEDLNYIKQVDEELYYNLGQFVSHYEVQIWEGPEGEVDYCNDYFSWDAAYKGYKEALGDGYEYVRIVSVDSEGMPDGEVDKFSW